MKTIFISTSLPGRARPDYFFALANSFVENGYRVIMIFDGKVKEFPAHKKILFYTWPNVRPTKMTDFLFLKRLIKKYKPDILISSFGSVNVMNVCGYIFNVKNRVNYILSVSEPHYSKPSYNTIIRSFFLRIRKRYIYNLATLLVCNSIGTEQDSKKYYKLYNNKFLVLHNLIRNSLISYKPEIERKFQILIVGNLIKRKGHYYLLEQIRKTIGHFPFLKLVIVGSGNERKFLELEVERLTISQNVEFAGEVSNKNIAIYFAESLISVSASLHEAFGFVNIEAMREGTPIITTKTAGGLEIIEEGVNGCFFDLKESDSLTESVRTIMKNWGLYSQNAIRMFYASYSLEKQIDNHRDSLKTIFK